MTIRSNIIRHAARGINLISWNGVFPSVHTRRVAIQNNLFIDIGTALWVPAFNGVSLYLIQGDVDDVTIEHNTYVTTPAIEEGRELYFDEDKNTGFVYRNNLSACHTYGVFGGGEAGTSALDKYCPGWVYTNNVLVEGNAQAHSYLYSNGNHFLESFSDVEFIDLAGGDYRLAPTSAYKNAGSDGKDIGVDMDQLNAALSGTSNHVLIRHG